MIIPQNHLYGITEVVIYCGFIRWCTTGIIRQIALATLRRLTLLAVLHFKNNYEIAKLNKIYSDITHKH